MKKEMLINTVEGQECRIAIVSDGALEELYVERSATASHVGNIYKARVTNVEAAIQAAFVDTGLGRNGFLHISDVNPTFFPKSKGKKVSEKVGQKRPHYVRPPIQECLRRGQEIVVQMIKEGIGTKGPTMTSYLSIPGRLLVMMPGMTRLGVSRKVENDDARRKARQALSELNVPQDVGFIVRTAGVDRSRRDLQRDLNYLLRLWKTVEKRIKTARAPVELYRESDLVTRTVRDVYNSDIERIICDSESVARRVQEFLRVAMPRSKHVIEVYTGKEGLFYDRGVEAEIELIHSRRVPLPAGGSLVFDQTEALVAIDVNSGRFRQHSDAETTALKINLQAATEVSRQLRLRDLGGVIVIDFIDMREERNRRKLERTLRDALKQDRAKTKILRTNAFGIIELTRQRLGPSLEQSAYARCPHCDGTGLIKSQESLSLQVMRSLQRACANENVAHVEVSVPPEVAHHLSNFQRRQISRLEAETGRRIVIRADADLSAGNGAIKCLNARGSEVTWEHPVPDRRQQREVSTINIDDLPPPAPRRPEPPAGVPEEPAKTDAAPKAEEKPAPEPARDPKGADGAEEKAPEAAPAARKGRRGRRGGRKHRRRREAAAAKAAEVAQAAGDEPPEPAKDEQTKPEAEQAPKPAEPADAGKAEPEPKPAPKPSEPAASEEAPKPKAKAKRTRRKPAKKKAAKQPAEDSAKEPEKAEPVSTPGPAAADKAELGEEAPEQKPAQKKRRRRKKAKKAAAPEAESEAPAE